MLAYCANLQVDSDLVSINEKLKAYEAAWDAHVDAWLVVKVGSPEWVYSWRLQAEHAMVASGRPGMTDDQVSSCRPAAATFTTPCTTIPLP